jgi:parvulin-like peptidyl-prolyl isomerase
MILQANANLELEQLLETLAQSGVDEQTYRDFIMVGVTWRELIRARFAARSAPSEAEIDRALASAGAQGGVKVLLTEIVLPAGSAEELNNARQTAERLGPHQLNRRFLRTSPPSVGCAIAREWWSAGMGQSERPARWSAAYYFRLAPWSDHHPA